jgi:DNA-binding IclR family transcriptional regulator
MPPLGSIFATWGGEPVVDRWLAQLDPSTPAAQLEAFRGAIERVRSRGFAVSLGHQPSARVESLSARLATGDPDVSSAAVRAAIRDAANCYNPEALIADKVYELRSLSAPVLHPDGRVAFSLTLWGPPGEVTGAELTRRAERLRDTAAASSAAIRHAAPLAPAQ